MPEANFAYVNSPAQLDTQPDAGQTWLRPIACQPLSVLKKTNFVDVYLALAGGWTGFTNLDVVTRKNTGAGYQAWRTDIAGYLNASQDAVSAKAALLRLSQPRAPFAGLDMTRPHIIGVVNVTPDSFSDGGQFSQTDQALAHARQMQADGASLLDIGGESTRPGAPIIGSKTERERILPVITALVREGHLVSCDTRHSDIMHIALDAGARIINDVSGFTSAGAEKIMAGAYKIAPDDSFAIAMHMQGTPQTMQDRPSYEFAPIDIYEVLKSHIARLVAAGLPLSHIAIDPGFGFGKTPLHNQQIIDWMSLFHGLGVPVLIGVSRKSSLPILAAEGLGAPASGFGADAGAERLGGGLSLSLIAAQQGAQFFRTHDVAPTYQALSILIR